MSNCSITAAGECADGHTAGIMGQTYDVYRLTSASQHDWIDDANKIGSMKVYYELSKNDKPGLETERRQGFIWYRVTGNFSSVKLGDVFVLNDACVPTGKLVVPGSSDYQGFCFVQARSGPKKPFGARLNTTVKIYRPKQCVEDGYHQPLGEGQGNPVILANGAFELVDKDTDPCPIPAGLSAMRPYGGPAVNDVDSMNRKSLFGCYLPPLNGFNVVEGDRIVEANGARYVVLVSHFQGTGAVGYQLTLEREVDNQDG